MRTADYERWQQLDFVVGIKVELSNNHTCRGVKGEFVDICDELAGEYPKDFKFVGWHPHCRCHAVPILKTPEEMKADNERIMRGEEPSEKSVNEVKEMPKNFNEWMKNNEERIKSAKSMPYFIKDNGTVLGASLSSQSNSMAVGDYSVTRRIDLTKKEKKLIHSGISTIKNAPIFENFQKIEITNEIDPTEPGVMMTWNNGVLKIHTHEVTLNNGDKSSAARELASAFDKLQKGKWGEASFYEEYAIECLFHESVHSHQIIPLFASRFSADYAIHEACTQMYARENYHNILTLFGAVPNHQLMIRINGLGYKSTCNSLRTFFQNPDGTMKTSLLREIAICEKEPEFALRELLVKRGYSFEEIKQFFIMLKIY